MNLSRRALIPVLALALAFTACGGGESDEDRAAVVDMLQRLGRSSITAKCIAAEWDGQYAAEDLQPLIDARGDFSAIDFELIEDLVTAEATCLEDS